MKVKRDIIEIDEELCDGCGDCIPACEEGAIEIVDGKAKVVKDIFCDGLGACLDDCPAGALSIIERTADQFEEEAVKRHLSNIKREALSEQPSQPGGCPSAGLQSFNPLDSRQQTQQAVSTTRAKSALTQWPVQIHLVPPTAPFLQNSDLLVAADCVPVAYANFHQDFLQEKTIMMGCPKLDDAQSYVEKFAAVFKQADIRSLTTVIMEVPCCSGLPMIVKQALEKSGQQIPLEEVIVSIREGKIL